jgi:hypothetical protein
MGMGPRAAHAGRHGADTLTPYYRGHTGLAMLQVSVTNGLTGILLLICTDRTHRSDAPLRTGTRVAFLVSGDRTWATSTS